MGCRQPREKNKKGPESSDKQEELNKEAQIMQQSQSKILDNEQQITADISQTYCQIQIQEELQPTPSISFNDDNQNDSIMEILDLEIFDKRQSIIKNNTKTNIYKKYIIKTPNRNREIKSHTPNRSREKKQNEKEFRKVSSYKFLDGNQIPKNQEYHLKYQKYNRIRMKNKINNNMQQQENLENSKYQPDIIQNVQIESQMVNENCNKGEKDNQILLENEESFCSGLSELDTICFNCQNKISEEIFQLECLHHYHINCLSEIIIQQINNHNLKVFCRCNQVIRTQILALILKEKDIYDEQNTNQKFLEIYFKNQYDFLNQNLY